MSSQQNGTDGVNGTGGSQGSSGASVSQGTAGFLVDIARQQQRDRAAEQERQASSGSQGQGQNAGGQNGTGPNGVNGRATFTSTQNPKEVPSDTTSPSIDHPPVAIHTPAEATAHVRVKGHAQRPSPVGPRRPAQKAASEGYTTEKRAPRTRCHRPIKDMIHTA
ncbi:hypothetical protein INS49_004601 [Diaporthe citri]|uniref:uncharacterized protein n=1 Tax=Diaporthe citri TaxID=83186 RepID=UPI001C80F017|nr:uncharacterized protein INS49_004601 [Diaporthe citri]KAG6354583.1 hypothetical protein INS49_004601 [Diaporthe citri]